MTEAEFPDRRLRRNRYKPAMRRLVRETNLSKDDLIQPIFVKESLDEPVEIETLPGQKQHTVDSAVEEIHRCEAAGLPGVIIFGIPAQKDATGSSAAFEDGIVQKTIRKAQKQTGDILLIADVCLCQYTDHGHCGILAGKEVNNDATIDRLAEISLSLADAGADVIAPSDMMDGRVQKIRKTLDKNNFLRVSILSYAVKYASSFYGPFRGAAESAPGFGDRSSYQMDPANGREALCEASQEAKEGADWLMVKPALPYLDIISRLRNNFHLPLAAYCVSGEYTIIETAARKELIERTPAIIETLTSIKRAGADAILTYWAREVAEEIG